MNSTVSSNWNKILEILRTEFNILSPSFNTFIVPLKVYGEDENSVTILIENEAFEDFIKNKYGIFIDNSVEAVMGKHYTINFITNKSANTYDKKEEKFINLKRKADGANLNPRYTFDTFVVGSNNKFAHAASLAVAEAPAKVYNPLFIYGGVGLGKTHLMHSIAHYILEKEADAKVLYVTSENFTNELIESIRGGSSLSTPEKFREKYRNIDVLLIDDIQFIIGKESTQEEFFHTFNELHQAGKQIIISSDKPPKDFTTLEERLRSRFEMGLIADIQMPDYETRMAILRKKEELDGLSIDDDVLNYIADNVISNIRELEGALTKIVAFGKLENTAVNRELAEKALKDIISPQAKKEITISKIVEIVADHYAITSDEIISNKKSSNLSYPRQICMFLARKLTNMNFKDIGIKLGNKDHSTVVYGEKKIIGELEKEKENGKTELTDNIDILIKKIST